MDPLRLVGTWDFRREIEHADGATYTADGEARFWPQDDGRVRWTERGTLRWDGGSTPVSRTLFLVRDVVGGEGSGGYGSEGDGSDPSRRDEPAAGSWTGWRVTFEDGRDFHPWTAGAVEHLCGRDLYTGGLAVAAVPASQWEQWELSWHVTGPEKDYVLHTRYTQRP